MLELAVYPQTCWTVLASSFYLRRRVAWLAARALKSTVAAQQKRL